MTQPAHVQTSHPNRKLGLLPNDRSKPRLRLAPFLRAGYTGTVPDVVDYSGRVPEWPIYRNSDLGDCTAAAAGHAEQIWSMYGTGSMVEVTDADVITFYSGSTGYDPADPSTDQGGVMQDVMAYWRKTGLAGHRLAAFFELDPRDIAEVRAALYLFGGVNLGVALPQSALDQTDFGRPWDVSARNAQIVGGHDVWLVAMDAAGNGTVVTWGRLQRFTRAFWDRYIAGNGGEAWGACSAEWVAQNRAPSGLEVAALNAAFTSLTGEPGPFPAAPAPAPAPADPDAQLVAAFAEWRAAKRHLGAVLAAAVQRWKTAKGL